jgi:hypothetical protein
VLMPRAMDVPVFIGMVGCHGNDCTLNAVIHRSSYEGRSKKIV